eukprot:XP_011671870.1 PREDICTED: ATP-dependent RNA helicase SUPV3L1, mitochondrial [Strongylocentrotus purpuratus]
MRDEVAVIDEIQMLRDPSRGWAWTRALLVNVNIQRSCKFLITDNLENVKPGDCIVAFSKNDLYSISRQLFSMGKECAVIYGSLPPGAKLSQAAKFNDPDDPCKILVATDAIGMGLNLSIKRVIFKSLIRPYINEKGEKEMHRLTTSQALQIAGRAGRFRTQFEEGEATTFHGDDLPLLKEILANPVEKIEAGGLHPTAEQIELFAYHLPDATLSNLIEIFINLSIVEKNYFVCNVDDFKFLADMIQHVPLHLRARYVFCCAPINRKLPFICTMFLKFARQYSRNQPITFDWFCRSVGWPLAVPKNIRDLMHLEAVHDVMDLYLWLSYRFMDMFPDTALIQDVQAELDHIIQMGVINITKLIRASETRSNGMTAIPDPDIEQKKSHGKIGEHKAIDTDAIDGDARVNGYNGDTKELTKKEKKKLASLPLGRKIPMSRAASSETSTVQSPDSSFERSGPSPAKSKRSKFTKSASMDSGAKHPEDTLAKPAGYEVDGQRSPGAARRGKKHDRLRTPEASPPGTLTREYIPLKSDNEGSVGSDNHGRPRLAKLVSMGSSFDVFSKSIDIMSDISEADSIDLSMMTKFYYSVRIFPGQDPTDIHVGWVTPGYHHYAPHFDPSKTSEVTVNMLGENGGVQESSKRRDCFTVCVGDHMDLLITPEGRRISSGLVVGCVVDACNGELYFTINGRDISTKYQVEPKTKLFPAVFVKPTSKEMLQFELGRSKILERRSSSVQSEIAQMSVNQSCLPLSAAWFRGDTHNPHPSNFLSRVEGPVHVHQPLGPGAPLQTMNIETKKMSDNNGWLVSCPEPVSWLGVHIPEENRCMDILELVEHEDLLKFHAHTLRVVLQRLFPW